MQWNTAVKSQITFTSTISKFKHGFMKIIITTSNANICIPSASRLPRSYKSELSRFEWKCGGGAGRAYVVIYQSHSHSLSRFLYSSKDPRSNPRHHFSEFVFSTAYSTPTSRPDLLSSICFLFYLYRLSTPTSSVNSTTSSLWASTAMSSLLAPSPLSVSPHFFLIHST